MLSHSEASFSKALPRSFDIVSWERQESPLDGLSSLSTKRGLKATPHSFVQFGVFVLYLTDLIEPKTRFSLVAFAER